MAKIQEFVKEYLRPLLGSKNTVKFSITIPYLSITMCCLFCDHFLCCDEAVLASYPFLGLLLLLGVVNLERNNSLKWLLFNIVSGGQVTSDALWK